MDLSEFGFNFKSVQEKLLGILIFHFNKPFEEKLSLQHKKN